MTYFFHIHFRLWLCKSIEIGLYLAELQSLPCFMDRSYSVILMPPPPTIDGERHYVSRSSVRPSVNTYFVWCGISLLSGEISVKLAGNIRRARGNCWPVFQGQRSEVKVITRWNGLFWQRDTRRLAAVRPLSVRRRHTDRRCGVEADLFTKKQCAYRRWCEQF